MITIILLFINFISCQNYSSSIFATEDLQQLLALELAIKNFVPEPIPPPREEYDEDDRFFWSSEPKAPKIPPVARMGTEQEARKILRYASVAYCPLEQVQYWRCPTCDGTTRGASDITIFNNNESETYGYLAVNSYQKMIVISIRGTHGLMDWIGNTKVSQAKLGLPYPFQDAMAHNGFNDFANGITWEVSIALRRAMYRYPSCKVVFTGHSKGGAIASLLAIKMVQYNVLQWHQVHLYTYGMPRVGNPTLAKYINSVPITTLRVTSYADITPLFPRILYDYEHFQYNLHINKDKQSYMCSIFEEDPDCTNDFWIPSMDAHYTYWNLRVNTNCK